MRLQDYQKFVRRVHPDDTPKSIKSAWRGCVLHLCEVKGFILGATATNMCLDKKHLEQEIGGLLCHVAQLCNSADIDMEQVLQKHSEQLARNSSKAPASVAASSPTGARTLSQIGPHAQLQSYFRQ